ncbi:MAG: type II toxin-antitoxin system Phd/YefM family antitoxin [Phycisphaerales bacterium]|nr:type II toxin-antitoxin system Phd/YefM family antitoxin [Phycisphaerales bacterium]
MIQVNIVEFRDNTADLVNRVLYNGERVVLERRGKGVAAVVSLEDLLRLEEMEDKADVKAARKARKEKGSVSLAEVKKRLGMK